MSLNWKEIDLILKELDLEGALIQAVNQPVHNKLIFDLHKPGRSFSLIVCLAAGVCRIHELTKKTANPKTPQRFASFLRAHIKGGRVIGASQIKSDRIIKITVAWPENRLIVWIRLWANAANMIVTDEAGNIIDACYRRTNRGEMTGGFYNPEKEPQNLKKSEKEFQVRDIDGEGSFNSRIEAYYNNLEQTSSYENLFKKGLSLVESRISSFESALIHLDASRKDDENYLRLKEIGDIILTFASNIKKGDSWLIAEDFYNDNKKIEIKLSPQLSAFDNADKYYKKSQKAKRNLELTVEKIANTKQSIESLKEKREKILTEKNLSVLKNLIHGLQDAGQTAWKNTPKEIPGLCFFSGEFQFLVGRSASENDKLLRGFVRGNDYWLHCRDYPGGYVFIKSKRGKSIPLDILLDAGNLALLYSKGKNSAKGDVYYTQVKYLRRPKDGKKGLVLPTQEKNLFINLDRERIEKLKKTKEFY